jgi:SAM-dependent methyltransferase
MMASDKITKQTKQHTKRAKRTNKRFVFAAPGIAAVFIAASAFAAAPGFAAGSAIRNPQPARQQPPHPPDVHFAATPQPVADAMLKLARVTSTDVVYDLGSGDGRIVILAAQKYGARGVGIEIDPRLVELSRMVARDGEVTDRVTFVEGDLFAADISPATVVTLWLTAGVNARLQPKLLRELRPGTRIVAHQFPIGQWPPEQTVRFDGEEIFLWTVPPR